MRRPFRIGATRHMMVPARTSKRNTPRADADVKCPMHALTRPCQQACEPTMNKPSERIVVFVTTAQKRAITSTAENLGISVSELMRRAVLSFGATSEQVKAASIVDRLRAPRAPDALNAALQRVARGTRHARAALPAQLQVHEEDETDASADESVDEASASTVQSPGAASSSARASAARGAPATAVLPLAPAAAEAAPLLPAGLAAALAAEADQEAAATAEAVARVAAAESATFDESTLQQAETEAQLRRVLKRPRADRPLDDDDPRNDPSTEGGRFA